MHSMTLENGSEPYPRTVAFEVDVHGSEWGFDVRDTMTFGQKQNMNHVDARSR
jgi:hypothetical protein